MRFFAKRLSGPNFVIFVPLFQIRCRDAFILQNSFGQNKILMQKKHQDFDIRYWVGLLPVLSFMAIPSVAAITFLPTAFVTFLLAVPVQSYEKLRGTISVIMPV
jgi:hypothetical protein